MPTFDREALRKGSKAIDEALESRGGDGEFRPFLPNIYWKKDKEHRYLQFLTPLEEIWEVDLHPYIDCDDGKPHTIMSHTDRAFGNAKDEIQEKWGYKPRLTGLAIAVELEPITEIVNGRAKPVGFEVAITTFDRKVRDEEGNTTDEKEEVTVPLVGLVAQSPFNFFNQIKEYDTSEASIHTTPVKITRMGEKTNVSYQVVGYDTIKPDLTNLFEYVENLSWVDDSDTLLQALDEAGDDVEAACTAISDHLLNKRIDELADLSLYNEILSKISKPAKFQDQKSEKTTTKRPSQRRNRQATGEEEVTARSREEGEAESKPSPKSQRMAKLRAQSRSKKNESE